eukprot:3788-Heterococcus_DN1.PRE.1
MGRSHHKLGFESLAESSSPMCWLNRAITAANVLYRSHHSEKSVPYSHCMVSGKADLRISLAKALKTSG